METSSDEEEDGQISKLEEEEEKDRKLFGKKDAEDEPITMNDLEKCRLTRDGIAKHCMVPWFEDYVKGMVYNMVIVLFLSHSLTPGAWVRYLVGMDEHGEAVYRICEVTSA
jgi:RNA polymerase-associated protein RTF1